MTHLSSPPEAQEVAVKVERHGSELPKTTAQFDLVDSGDRTTIDLDENWF